MPPVLISYDFHQTANSSSECNPSGGKHQSEPGEWTTKGNKFTPCYNPGKGY